MRIEADNFGTAALPEGTLYGINTLRTVENLTFSGRILSHFPVYISSLAEVKKAAALANGRAGQYDEAIRDAIVAACDLLIAGRHHDQFPVDVFHGGGSIGINMNINEVIARLAGPGVDPVDHVNASQSTSDVCHTAIRVALLKLAEPLCRALSSLADALEEKAGELGGVETIARTCLQDGMKVSLGVIFSGISAALRRRLESLRAALDELYAVNLGGTVIGCGTGASDAYRAHILEALREVTGLPLRHRKNLYDAAQHPDDLARVSSELRLLAGLLVKCAKDLRLLSSGPEAGLAEIRLPAVQAGSSFFPGKVNPVVPETLIQCGFLVTAYDHAVQMAIEHGELHLNVWEGLAGILAMEAMQMLASAVAKFERYCVRGIRANLSRCEAYANSFVPLVVALKETYGYRELSELVKNLTPEEIKETYGRREKP